MVFAAEAVGEPLDARWESLAVVVAEARKLLPAAEEQLAAVARKQIQRARAPLPFHR